MPSCPTSASQHEWKIALTDRVFHAERPLLDIRIVDLSRIVAVARAVVDIVKDDKAADRLGLSDGNGLAINRCR